ncbi:MAG: metallophosphoesterase [Nitrosopumilus sp.]|nr:metallophosphoesterase [Nitrosopumilus sp.]
MIIAFSDTHLKYYYDIKQKKEKSNSGELLSFLQSNLCQELGQDDDLVLLGDIFEFWRRKNVDAVLESGEILSELYHLKEDNKVPIHYIQGNHDYSILGLYQNSKKYPFEVTPDWRYQSKDDGTDYYFVHGYQLAVFSNYEPLMNVEDYENICQSLCERSGDTIGTIMSTAYSIPKKLLHFLENFEESIKPEENKIDPLKKLKEKIDEIMKPADGDEREKEMDAVKNLTTSPLARSFFLGMKPEEFLIFGHTHKPFCNIEKKVANTGSWVGDGDKVNTFVQIDSEKVELKQWKDGKVVPFPCEG